MTVGESVGALVHGNVGEHVGLFGKDEGVPLRRSDTSAFVGRNDVPA